MILIAALLASDALYSFDLKVPGFELSGTLSVWMPKEEPGIGYEQLSLRTKSGQLRIQRLSDLQGHCRISTSAEALAFVRLRTSPATFSLFSADGTLWLEPIEVKDVTQQLLYGLPLPKLEDLTRYAGRRNSIYRAEDGFVAPRPVVIKSDGCFEVNRVIEEYPLPSALSKGKTFEVVEVVDHDGRYTVTQKRALNGSTRTDAHGYTWDRAIYASCGGG